MCSANVQSQVFSQKLQHCIAALCIIKLGLPESTVEQSLVAFHAANDCAVQSELFQM